MSASSRNSEVETHRVRVFRVRLQLLVVAAAVGVSRLTKPAMLSLGQGELLLR